MLFKEKFSTIPLRRASRAPEDGWRGCLCPSREALGQVSEGNGGHATILPSIPFSSNTLARLPGVHLTTAKISLRPPPLSVPVPRAFSCNQRPEGKIGERVWWFCVWMRRFLSVSCPGKPDRAQGQDTSTLSPSPHTAPPSEEGHWCSALRLSPAGLPQSLGVEGGAEPLWSDTHEEGCGSEPLGSLLSNMDSEWTPVLTAQVPPEPW